MREDKFQAMTARAAVLIDVAEAVALLALVVCGLLAIAVAIVPAAELPAGVPAAGAGATTSDSLGVPAAIAADSFAVTAADTSIVFVLEIGSRLYPDWRETRRVHLQERFVIGDTENAAVVTKLLPDFRILEGGPRSISARLANPAVRIYVSRGEAVTDSAWAFLNFPPHYSARSFFTFQLKEIVGYPAPHAAAEAAPEAAAPAPATGQKLEGE